MDQQYGVDHRQPDSERGGGLGTDGGRPPDGFDIALGIVLALCLLVAAVALTASLLLAFVLPAADRTSSTELDDSALA